MEKPLFHAKDFDNRFSISTEFWIHILENVVGIIHLIHHQIQRCMRIVKGCCKDDLTILIYQTIKSTDFARLDKLFKEISCLMIPFLLESFDIFCRFQFKGCSCSHSIIRLGNQRQTKLLNSQICPSFCVDNLTWNDWNTCFFKELLHL